MISFLDLLVVVGMFALRIGVPLAVTVGLVYLLKRLDARWEAEARAEQAKAAELAEAEQPAERPAAPQPGIAPVPSKRAPAPQPQLPFLPPRIKEPVRPQPGLAVAPAPQPCWEVKGCSDSAKAKCAAPQNPGVPCWQARFDAEGKIPEECVTCDIFQRYPKM